jgi:hypothetical protein
VLLCVLVIVLIGAVYGLVRLFFADDEAVALTDVTTYGALTKTIEGTGTVLPSDSQIVTAASKAEILNVYVAAGDVVKAGDPIYLQDDSEVDDKIGDYYDDITTRSSSWTTTTISSRKHRRPRQTWWSTHRFPAGWSPWMWRRTTTL